MALSSSGSLSFSQIESEFGSNTGRKLGNYRISQTVGQLSNLPLDTGIPQTGTIKFSDFRGKELNIVVDCFSNSPGGSNNYNFDAYSDRFASGNYVIVGGFRTSVTKAQWNDGGVSGKTVIIHINQTFGSNGASNRDDCAFCTGPQNNNNNQPGWPSTTELSVNVGTEGYVSGRGGKGGHGGQSQDDGFSGERGELGFPGTSAMKIISGTPVIGEARIFAGGGGGGGGTGIDMSGEAGEDAAPHSVQLGGAGGGGGAGIPGGVAGEGSTSPQENDSPDGEAGGQINGGEGGLGFLSQGQFVDDDDHEQGRYGVRAGNGGNGGNRGQNGNSGTLPDLINQGHQDYGSDDFATPAAGGLAGHKYRNY